MSSGSFVKTFYEDNKLNIRRCRVQPETITTWNPAPTGPATADRVRVSGGKRKIARKARYISLVRNIGAVVDGIQPVQRLTVPILTTTGFDALVEGSTVTYNGNDYEIVNKLEESGVV